MLRALIVGSGGFLGTVARYWVSGLVHGLGGPEFPYGTLVVNIVGSFVLGLVMALSLDRGAIGPDARIFLAVGVCGGFTTMSTFSYETLALLRDGSFAAGTANVLGTVASCLASVWLGDAVGRIM